MNGLRKVIRKILLEIYELSDKDKHRSKEFYDNNGNQIPMSDRTRRMVGLQSKEQIESDRNYLTDYGNRLPTEVKKEFMNPTDITIAHSISYKGWADGRGVKSKRPKLPHLWVKKYGKRGRDQLSTVALWGNIANEDMEEYEWGSNIHSVLTASPFFWFLKGYPVFISHTDCLTQTLGALPKGLKTHQKNSGIAKRVSPYHGPDSEIVSLEWFENGHVAEEVILDNWQIIGGGINMTLITLLEFKEIAQSALQVLNTVSIYAVGKYLGKIDKNSDLEKIFKEVYSKFKENWAFPNPPF